jgi:hypothetical protein
MSITLNFTINIDSAMLTALLATARDIQLTQTIDPNPAPPPSENSETNSVVDPPSPDPPSPQPQVPPAPAQLLLITNERKKVRWEKKSITLVSEEDLNRITNQIEMGELSSGDPGVSWYAKHHPLKLNPLKIVDALRRSSTRTLSFQSLLAQTGLQMTGSLCLQSYLREMVKQGVITYTPRD